jgi:hypothetical protein
MFCENIYCIIYPDVYILDLSEFRYCLTSCRSNSTEKQPLKTLHDHSARKIKENKLLPLMFL